MITTDEKSIALVRSEIVAAYLQGASSIELRGSNVPLLRADLTAQIGSLGGLEIIDSTESSIIAKDILDIANLNAEHLIRRIDLCIRSMFQDASAPLHEDFSESIFLRDEDVNRLTLLGKRLIIESLKDPARSGDAIRHLRNWTALCNLEAIADDLKRASRHLAKNGSRDKGELYARYLDAMRALHTDHLETAHGVESTHKEELRRIDSTSSGPSCHHLKGIASHTKEIARAVTDLCAVYR